MELTERYEVESLDPLCDGWKYGYGFDKRLQRPVLLGLIPAGTSDFFWFQHWLQKRSGISHPFVAEMLDGERLDESFLCAFSQQKKMQIGLPTLTRENLYEAAVKITTGVQALLSTQVYFHFSAGQVLWDGESPRLLGLPSETALGEEISENELCHEIGQYILHLLDWDVSVQIGQSQVIPPYLKAGIERLHELLHSEKFDFDGLLRLLRALQAGESINIEHIKSRQKNAVNPILTGDHELPAETIESELEDPFSDEDEAFNTVTAFPLRSWIIIAFVVIAVIAGLIFYFDHRTVHVSTVSASHGGSSQSGKPKSSIAKNHNPSMPNFKNTSLATAISQLQAMGVTSQQLEIQTQVLKTTAGKVLSTTPAPGSTLNRGEKVTLLVALTTGQRMIPDLSGLSLKEAEQMLSYQYAYTYKSDSNAPVGTVISQSPEAYSIHSSSTVVHFVVAAHY